jgi:hypothetical protein
LEKQNPIVTGDCVEEDEIYHRAILPASLDIVKDSSSALTFDRAAKWLSYCVSNHEECKIANPKYMPRRLLNVGWDTIHDPFLFEPTEAVPYVCLSYCWGTDSSDVLKTTKQNLKAHYEAVRLSELPRTISDAVMLCRALKLNNLWVDSICIVQDDRESWLQDSAQMREIYSNSHLTVAAKEPASCKLGFLGEQRFGKPEWQRKILIDIPIQAGARETKSS